MKNLKVKNDFIFKRIFGHQDNIDILKSLLQAILDVEINELELITDTKLLKDRIDDKQGILDIRATFNNGEHVNIEVQLINQYNMDKRTLFYWAKMFAEQLKPGNAFDELKKTITINILDFDYIEGIEKYHTTYHLREDEFKDNILTDVLEIHFLEIPKFEKKHEPNFQNPLERWLLFIDNPSEEVLDMIEEHDPAIKKANSVLDYLANDKETMRLYELREKAIHDEVTRLEGAKREGHEKGMQEGHEKGIQEGLAKGMQDGMKNAAINMINKGFDIPTIVEVTGLNKDVVNKLLPKA